MLSFRYVLRTCLEQTRALPDIIVLLLVKDASDTSLPSARPCRMAGDSAHMLQLLLSDKCRYTEQELLFFLGIASLEKRIAQTMANQETFKKTLRTCAKHAQM